MSTQQIELPETHLIKRAPDPLEILQAAVDKGLQPETLKQLMELQERWEANEARKEFVEAMNAFKKNPPEILKNRHVKFGNTEYDHATLDHVCQQVSERLSAHGISHRWTVEQADARIKVTCVLTHQRGHSETTTLEGPPDNSGSKNAIQAVGSAVTYLQRYTLLAATGLAAKGQDTDGVTNPHPSKAMEDVYERLEWIGNCKDLVELQRIYGDAYKIAKSLGDERSMILLSKAKDEKKREFIK